MGVWEPLGGGGLGGGGVSLGTARGAIVISTDGVSQAAVEVRRVSGDVEKSFEKIGQSADRNARQAGTSVRGLGNDLRALRGELAAVSLAAGGITAAGIAASTSMRGARIQFREMLGDEQKATELMAQLREQADKYGLSLTDVNATAAALLPSLEGNTTELDKWVSRAARLSTKGPFAGTEKAAKDATRAIAEFIAGQEISLQRLFNIAPNLIAEAKAEAGGDTGRALDIILEKIGATERGAQDMANSFQGAMNRAKNAAMIALDTGFTPILDDFLTPGIEKATEFLTALQDTNPELLTMGAGLTLAAAAGAPLLLVLGQIIQSLRTIQSTNIGTGLGQIAGLGVAGVAGVQGGVAISRGLARSGAVDNPELANATQAEGMVLLARKVGETLLIVTHAVNEFGIVIVESYQSFQRFVMRFGDALGQATESLGHLIAAIGYLTGDKATQDTGLGLVEYAKKEMQVGTQEYTEMVRRQQEDLRQRREANLKAEQDSLDQLAAFFPKAFGGEQADSAGAAGSAGLNTGGGLPNNLTQEQVDAWQQFQDDLAQISEDAQKDRLDEEQRYEEQRTKTIEDYARDRQKVIEDAEIRIARATEDSARQIAEVRANAAEREAQEAQDYQERIARLQTDYQKDEVRRVEDFQRDERRARAQHYLSLLSAAARLDARAVAEENRRYSESRDQKAEDFDIETQRRAEQLQERLGQEQQGHEERIEEARRADERRIRDLQNALARETRLIAEDAQRRLQLMAEAHSRELQELYNSHITRLTKIAEWAKEETDKRTEAFDNEITDMGGYWGGRFSLQQQAHQNELNLLAVYLQQRANLISGWSDPRHEQGQGGIGGYALGGPVYGTGPAMLHGSRGSPEYVLSPDTTSMLNRMLGGSFSQPQLVNAVAGGGGGSSYSFSGNIVLGDIGGRSDGQVMRLVQKGIMEAFRSLAGEA